MLLALLRAYDDTTTTAFPMMIMTGTKIDSSLYETANHPVSHSFILSLAVLKAVGCPLQMSPQLLDEEGLRAEASSF